VTLNFPQNIPAAGFLTYLQKGSTVSITSPTLIMNLIKNDSTTKVLANPTVRILDRQKARLLIGQRRPFLISSISSVPSVSSGTVGTTTGTTTSGAVTTTQTNVEYRDLGLKMTLTPTVHLDGEVTVEINFEISAIGPAIADVPGANLLPPVNTRNLDTFIKVRNGETRLLGGLYQEDASVANSKMPFLSEIPLVGRLFMSPNEQRSRTDVMISLTPRIVKAMNRPDADIESFNSGTADSFGPAAPAAPGGMVAPPRPALPTPQPSGQPSGGAAGPGAPAAPGASGPGPRP
jgi:general secretion pathway protein D